MRGHTASMTNHSAPALATGTDFLTVFLGDQIFGLPVTHVQDVLGPQRLTRVPLAPPEIEGSLNLRGRIVTAINMRARLNLPAGEDGQRAMSIVIEYGNELFSLSFDRVGDVMALPYSDFEGNPPNMDPKWRGIAEGIYRLEGRLLVVINIDKLLKDMLPRAADSTHE